MKLCTVEIKEAPMYKTVFLSSAHLSANMRAALLVMADKSNCYYCHRTTGDADTGIILRFDAIGGDWSEIEGQLLSDGLDDELTGLLSELENNGFDAVHFDNDFDLVAGFHWFTDEGQKVIPLAYDIWIEMDDADNNYFTYNGMNHYIADFMRLDDNSEMKSYGYVAECGESNTSALFIALHDDGDKIDLVRLV